MKNNRQFCPLHAGFTAVLRIQNDLVHAVTYPAVQVILDPDTPPDLDPTLKQDKIRK
jgi:hypothetical protein